MAVENEIAYSGPYTANGVTTVWPFSFIAASAEEIGVAVDGSELGDASFTVAIADDGTGAVTIQPAIQSGSIYIFSKPNFRQEFVFQRFGPVYPDRFNPPLDRAAIRDIYLKSAVDRGLKTPIGEQMAELPSAATRAGKALMFDAEGGLMLVDLPGTLGLGQDRWPFTAVDGQSIFPCPGSAGKTLEISVNGGEIYEDDYEHIGDDVILTQPADEGDVVSVVALLSVLQMQSRASSTTFSAVGGGASNTVSQKLAQFPNPIDFPWSAAGNGATNDRGAVALADARGPIIITANHRISSNLTFAHRPVFLFNGRLTIDAGVTVTFSDDYEAAETQIFYGAGAVAGLSKTNVAHFAGDLLGVAVDSVSRIQKAYDAVVERGVVQWPSGALHSNGTIITATKAQHTIGKGARSSRLLWLTSTANGIHHYAVEGPRVEGIGFDMADANTLATSGIAVLMGSGAVNGSVSDVRMQRGFAGGENVDCSGTLWQNVQIFDMLEYGKRAINSDNVSDQNVSVSAFSTAVDFSNTAGLTPGDPVLFSNGANGTFLYLTSSTRAHVVINDILPVGGNTANNGGAFAATVVAVRTPHRLGALRLENRCELYRGTNSTYAGGRFYMTITAANDARGTRPYACRFTSCDIDSAHEGMSVEKCDDITFVGCYLFNRAGYAATLEGTARRVNFHSTTIMASWLEALYVKTGAVACSFVDGKIVGANRSGLLAPGVTIEAGAGFRLTGNEIGGPNGYGGTPTRPWAVQAGAAARLRIGDNLTAGCANVAGEDLSTGPSKLITADYQ